LPIATTDEHLALQASISKGATRAGLIEVGRGRAAADHDTAEILHVLLLTRCLSTAGRTAQSLLIRCLSTAGSTAEILLPLVAGRLLGLPSEETR
jgi:hypothetical protein